MYEAVKNSNGLAYIRFRVAFDSIERLTFS